ncbi:MAG TPA: hypothetical protein VIG33_18020 [Pseudobdellovibrionaceae bacterium]|jgi:hypothetical protein
MNKYFYILAALSIVPNLSLAQAGNFDAEVDQELDQMYANKQAGTVASPAPTRGSVGGVAAQGSQPIYILNQATPTAATNTNVQTQTAQVQRQPVTLIESTPLTESKAELMRKSRQDAEVQTEQKIVEKLEYSRLEDEKKRAEVLFGNKFEQMQGNTTQIKAENSNVSVNTQQQATQVPVVVQAPVTPIEPKENFRDVVREELHNAMKVEEPIEVAAVETKYFAAIAGIGDYPDVRNVRGNYAFGAAFGTKYDQLIVEGSFLLSNYTVEKIDCNCVSYYPTLVDTNQYQGAVAAKYQMMSGLVRPVVGGLAAYSYRKYNWTNVVNAYPYSNYGTSSDSHAVDLGVTAGVDLELSKKFALGFEYKYMFNLSSRVNNQSIVTGPQYGTPIEKLSYYTMALAAKVNF